MAYTLHAPADERYVNQYAIFSEDRQGRRGAMYRYLLCRVWDSSLPTLMMILLNPSTATHTAVDPTWTRGENRARDTGYGSLMFVNLFAFRATNPKVMMAASDPVGPENDELLIANALACADDVIIAWGTPGKLMGRDAYMIGLLDAQGIEPLAYKVNKDGSPGHILYLPKESQPRPYQDLLEEARHG